MDGHHILAWLLIGLIAGALAGRVVDGGGFGLLGDIVIGLVGALIGGWIFGHLGDDSVQSTFVGECVVAFLGACVLLALVRVLARGSARGSRRRRRFGF